LQAVPQKYYKGITVSRSLYYIPRVAIFLAGIAAGAIGSGSRRGRGQGSADPVALDALKKALAELEARVTADKAANTARFQQVDTQLQEHSARLADVPSTSQIIAAMEQLLSKTMSSLDDRLTSQARSIEVLKTTVSQTDSLLERVLESLDSLQAGSEPSELPEESLVHRPAV
jgi:chromosome segregation ATPase